MNLVIQIPCFNEEKTLPITLSQIPKKIANIDQIKILVINDGSTDKTSEVAERSGADVILNLTSNRGLAEAFRRGIEKSIEIGADIIVNLDADNQYNAGDIPKLIEPIINRKAEIVIGCRNISGIKHFSFVKKSLQKIGSYLVRCFSRTNIPDTTSGFRAYTRDAAMRINIFSNYTYTIESLIQAGRKEIPMTYVDIKTNEKLRESRLIKSIPSYITRSIATMLRIYLMYEPLKSFIKVSMLPIAIGLVLIARFLVSHFTRSQGGHVQSLIIAAVGIITGLIIIMIGFLGDIISANRKLSEEILYRMKKETYGGENNKSKRMFDL